MPGNAGGGKDPCFWCAGERGNRAVIDDESTTPRNSADLSIPLCRSAKRVILGAVARHRGLLASEEYTSELQSPRNLVCRLLREKKSNRLHQLRRKCVRRRAYEGEPHVATR